MFSKLSLGMRIAAVLCTLWCIAVAVVGVDDSITTPWVRVAAAFPPIVMLLASTRTRWASLRIWASGLLCVFSLMQMLRTPLTEVDTRTKVVEMVSFGLIAVLALFFGVVWSVFAGMHSVLKRNE